MPTPTNPDLNTKTERNVVLRGLVKADTLAQIAIALPLSALIGWGLGDLLDHKLHHSWIAIVGLLLGVAAGLVQVIRLANDANRSLDG